MGNCKYCGESAGFLRDQHKECKAKHEEAIRHIVDETANKALAEVDPISFDKELQSLAENGFVDLEKLRDLVITGWEQAVDRAFDDGVLTEEEESRLMKLAEGLKLTQEDLDKRGYYTKLAQGVVLREILDGKFPEGIKLDGHIPFNMQKNERLIWVFSNVKYYEQQNKRQYVGGSSGVSLRIAKGVYYRVGAFKGHSINKTETVLAGIGVLGITDKHIYFASEDTAFRIRHDKIVAHSPYKDGVGIQRDGVRAKPQLFDVGDGWFIYNLLQNVGNL